MIASARRITRWIVARAPTGAIAFHPAAQQISEPLGIESGGTVGRAVSAAGCKPDRDR
ncbi:hypothetical protein [Rosistilla carotiformis]|uniref:hypothetical protein n=1 Tax=Rosistilla carotiformis TaxID=2528017 RepID=UPI0018D258D4|nr:hypothetical protein [Rosistilla carotiformis]